MPTQIVVRAVPGGLQAVNDVESGKLEQFFGREMMVTIAQPRNIRFHRKYFGLLGVARDMADTEFNAEQFRSYVTAGAGYCEFITDAEGGVVAVPKSISFSAMDDTEFERLYQDTVSFICKTWVIDQDQLNRLVDFL